MNIKTFFSYLIITSIFFVVISCRYEEGPAISFRNVDNRVQGTYNVNGFWINSIDCTSVYFEKCSCNYSFSYDKNTRYMSFRNCLPDGRGIAGSYGFKENKNILFMNMGGLIDINDTTLPWNTPISYFGPIGNMKYSEWTILKLKNKEMKLKCDFEGNEYILDLVKYDDNN